MKFREIFVLDRGCRDARVVVIGGSKSLFGMYRSHTGMARARDVQVEEPKNWSRCFSSTSVVRDS